MANQFYSPLDYTINTGEIFGQDEIDEEDTREETNNVNGSFGNTSDMGHNKKSQSYGATKSTLTSSLRSSNGTKISSIKEVSIRGASPTIDGRRFWQKTRGSFFEDAKNFQEGTIPQSIIVALVIGVVCGVSSYVYYQILFSALDYFWHTLPESIFIGSNWSEKTHVLWIPIIGFIMAIATGLSVKYIGEPGDLAYTIKCVHAKAYIKMDHVLPMVAASMFSILGGASLGPEAPLVAICAALGGFVSRHIFLRKNRNIIRKHTLMGMAGALSAFFGTCLGGSLFALEVNSRFGVEYFEHMIESIFCGQVCVTVFRYLSGMPLGPIWEFNIEPMTDSYPKDIMIGAALGLVGAGIAALFAVFHWKVMYVFNQLDLMDNKKAVQRALLASIVVISLGMLIPHTMFWGEFEFETIATMANADKLAHIWPTKGLIGFEMDSGWKAFIVGFCKLIAISFSVAGGYRGGFIFPFFACGAAFGQVVYTIFPQSHLPLLCLCLAAGINVGITRTALSTPIILCYLGKEPYAITAVLVASIVSLFATSYMSFIKTQILRSQSSINLGASQRSFTKFIAGVEDERSMGIPHSSSVPYNIDGDESEHLLIV